MKKAYFITGTDTEVGKTYSTVALIRYFNQQHLKTAALKPIASDAKKTKDGLRNDDALKLQAAISMSFSYEAINPITLEPAIAPHLAVSPNTLNVKTTLQGCQQVLNSDYDILFVEGAGGWLVPLNDKESFADFATALNFPIILVVGLRLGCINHALLTWENIISRQLPFAGWIANHVDPHMQKPLENIETLSSKMQQPPLATIPFNASFPNFNTQAQLAG